MARFLLCWEFGAGLGHAGRFKPLAQALLSQGHQVGLMLRDLVQTRTLLRDLDVPILQAPVWLHQTVGVPNPTVSLAEILMGNGYLSAASLEALVAGWRSAMHTLRPDVVVADYAPTATLAARTLGLPVATVGVGFSLPPDTSPMPAFRTWEPIAEGRLAHSEQAVLHTVNTVLAQAGARPLARLAELLRGDLPLLCTWPELDHYQRRAALPPGQAWFGPTFEAGQGEPPHWPDGTGPRVFAYLRAQHPDHAAVLQALAHLGCRTLCYMPEVAHGKAPPVVSAHIHYARGPVDLGQALPGCRLTVSHAGEATLAQSLLAGVPLLMLPLQAEQFLMANRVEEAGAGLNAALRPRPLACAPLLQALLEADGPHAQGARAIGQRHAGFHHTSQTAQLVQALLSLLQARGNEA